MGTELLELEESLSLEETVESALATVDGRSPRQLVVQRLFLDLGTENISNIPVRHPSRYYDARVLSFGTISRSVALPPDLPQISSASVRVADTDQRWRTILAPKTARRRRTETKVGVEGESEIGFQTVYSSEIQRASFPPGEASIQSTDNFFGWMADPIPNLINVTTHPNLPVGTQKAFFPIVYGVNSSIGFGAQGAMAPPYVDTVNFRYAVSRSGNLAWDAVVERKAPGDTEFSVVSDTEYSQVTASVTSDGLTFTCTYLQFNADQLGAEIRMSVKGGFDISAFGTLPFGRDGGCARNAVDLCIGMLFLASVKFPQIDVFGGGPYDYASFARAWQICDDEGLFCDGIVDEQMTWGEFFGRWSASTGISIYQNREGKIALAIPGDEEAEPPELDDIKYIYRESVQQDFLDRTYNRMIYSYGRLYGWAGNAQKDSQWGAQDTFNNDEDQILLGGTGPPIVEEDTRELWFCRDAATAEWVIRQTMRYFALDCLIITFVVPLPPNISRLELTKEAWITHYGGVKDGGFVRERVQIMALSHDLDKLETTVTAIRKAALPSIDVSEALTIADSEELETSSCLIFTEDFSGTPTAHGSNDLGTRVQVTAAFPFDANRSGCNITHDIAGECLHVDYVSGNGHGGITVTAEMSLAVPGIHELLEDSDQLSESACVADNSVVGSLTRCGPSVFQTGTWNGNVPNAYYICNLPELGKCVLKRITGSLISDIDIGTHKTAPLGSMLTITGKDNGSSVRIRLFVDGVLAEEVNDSSPDRIPLPTTDESLGWMETFCSAAQFSKWTPLVCVIPA